VAKPLPPASQLCASSRRARRAASCVCVCVCVCERRTDFDRRHLAAQTSASQQHAARVPRSPPPPTERLLRHCAAACDALATAGGFRPAPVRPVQQGKSEPTIGLQHPPAGWLLNGPGACCATQPLSACGGRREQRPPPATRPSRPAADGQQTTTATSPRRRLRAAFANAANRCVLEPTRGLRPHPLVRSLGPRGSQTSDVTPSPVRQAAAAQI
jgi:hypothetical protein